MYNSFKKLYKAIKQNRNRVLKQLYLSNIYKSIKNLVINFSKKVEKNLFFYTLIYKSF